MVSTSERPHNATDRALEELEQLWEKTQSKLSMVWSEELAEWPKAEGKENNMLGFSQPLYNDEVWLRDNHVAY